MTFRSTVYDEPGRFAGWPANYGMWAFDDEVVLVFLLGHVGPLRGVHARDMSRPFVPVVARSLDGGRGWSIEDFTGVRPGAATLSGDEHQDPALRAEPRITPADFVPLEQPIDFADPECLVLCARTGLSAGSVSWFYVSRDRGRRWSGPHSLPSFGQPGVSARTDIVPLGKDEALWLLSVAKRDGNEGRVLAAHTSDGGRSFTQRGWLGDEPDGFEIMSSSVLCNGAVLSAVRCHDADGCHIDLYRSEDRGHTWERIARPVPDTGSGGNPPVLLAIDDQLVCVFGFRAQPCGLRYVVSADAGKTWSAPIVVTDDTAMGDMGYPRAVRMRDDSILACFYSNRGDESERFIEAVRWSAPLPP